MKHVINYELISVMWAGLIFCTALIGGCQKGERGEETMLISLNEVPENPKYGSLPLVGTPWKLIGFADEGTGRIKLAESFRENSYTLLFRENGNIDGHTSTNEAAGKYSILEENFISIIDFNSVTEINEIYDGASFIDAMKSVNAFEMSSRGLMLHYEKDKFLLFKPFE